MRQVQLVIRAALCLILRWTVTKLDAVLLLLFFFWGAIWNHLRTSDGPLMIPLWPGTCRPFFNTDILLSGGGGLCSSFLPSPDHFHMCWEYWPYSAPPALHKWLLIDDRQGEWEAGTGRDGWEEGKVVGGESAVQKLRNLGEKQNEGLS